MRMPMESEGPAESPSESEAAAAHTEATAQTLYTQLQR